MSFLPPAARMVSLPLVAAAVFLWVRSYQVSYHASYNWVSHSHYQPLVRHDHGLTTWADSGSMFVLTSDEYADDPSVDWPDSTPGVARGLRFYDYRGDEALRKSREAQAWDGPKWRYNVLGFGEYERDLADPFDVSAPKTLEEKKRILPLMLAGKWPSRMTLWHSLAAHYRIPLWFLSAVFALPWITYPIGGWLRRRNRRRAGLCPACGYDLRGSHGACPECGVGRATAGSIRETASPPKSSI